MGSDKSDITASLEYLLKPFVKSLHGTPKIRGISEFNIFDAIFLDIGQPYMRL